MLTKDEAIALIRIGTKVTHARFTPDEYITMQNGQFIDEEGRVLHWNTFWKDRKNPIFDIGWAKYTEPLNS